MAQHSEVDAISGTPVTGHEWDGIKELNTPLPRWWVWIFYATIVFALGYWVVYPSWPTPGGYSRGAFGYSSRAEVVNDLAALQQLRGEKAAALAAAPLADIEKNPALLEFARAKGKAAFGDNCAPCHGIGATGAKGFPNLNDDDWLWGGTLANIAQTVAFGVRSGNPKGRESAMLAFGKEGVLKANEILLLARYVRSLSGLPFPGDTNIPAAKKLFADNCAGCHGDDAKGNQDLGAPNLTDKIWLYGSDEATLVETITNGRGGVMPAWTNRLDPVTIKSLAVYVHTLGGGQ